MSNGLALPGETALESLPPVPRGMVQDTSGLVVPAGTRQKQAEHWLRDDVKLMKRAAKLAAGRDLTLHLVCGTCGQECRHTLQANAELHLVCECRNRWLEGA